MEGFKTGREKNTMEIDQTSTFENFSGIGDQALERIRRNPVFDDISRSI